MKMVIRKDIEVTELVRAEKTWSFEYELIFSLTGNTTTYKRPKRIIKSKLTNEFFLDERNTWATIKINEYVEVRVDLITGEYSLNDKNEARKYFSMVCENFEDAFYKQVRKAIKDELVCNPTNKNSNELFEEISLEMNDAWNKACEEATIRAAKVIIILIDE